MKSKDYLVFIILLITTLLMDGCQPSTSIGKCIPPPVEWEFPVMATTTANSAVNKPEDISPSGRWRAETTLPIKGPIISIVSHSTDQIWILTEEKLLRYLISTQAWEEFSMIRDQKITPQQLYESKDGTLWGIGQRIKTGLDSAQKTPLLIRFDDEVGQFAFVTDRDKILNSGMDIVAITTPIKNPNSEIWMLVEEDIGNYKMQDSLISFNPTSLQATRHLNLVTSRRVPEFPESSFSDIAIPPDNNIWMADRGLGKLLYYNPATGISQSYQGDLNALDGFSSEDLRGYFNLYVDRIGRLWVDDRGWLDFSTPDNPIWHKVIRSPVFISDSGSPENQFVWS